MKPLALAALVLALRVPAALAQSPASTITFHFNNPALDPADFTLTIHEDGNGHYHAEPGSAPASNPTSGTMQTQPVDRDLLLSPATTAQAFTIARRSRGFSKACEKKLEKVAFTGNKTLSYTGPGTPGTCTFNYTRMDDVQELSQTLQAVATTLDEGAVLESLLVHDRLGLDKAVEQLATEQAAGRALEIGNIAPVLRAISSDDEVLHHTRARVDALLAHPGGTP